MFPLTDLSILFAALLIIAFLCFGLIVLLGMMICKRFGRHTCSDSTTRPVTPVPPPTTNTEAMLANLTAKIESNHAEDVRRAKGDRLEQVMLVLFSFALATIGLAVSALTIHEFTAAIISVVMAIGFLLFGFKAYAHLKNYKDLNWRNFWGD